MEQSVIVNAYLQGYRQWKGCNWATRFGSSQLNLEGLKSRQANLMAGSTAGEERADWRAATAWLTQVERDSQEAEEESLIAADLALLGQFHCALSHIERACELEAIYGATRVWQPLRRTIQKLIADQMQNVQPNDSVPDAANRSFIRKPK